MTQIEPPISPSVKEYSTTMTSTSISCRRRRHIFASFVSLLFLWSNAVQGYLSTQPLSFASSSRLPSNRLLKRKEDSNRRIATPTPTPPTSSTSLNVWWFGGTEQNEVNNNGDSCELVAVRIERTSANSRRIAGEITVPARANDVWSILTDYDRLAVHVPNLMESKILQRNSRGQPGDGSFRCRLFQKGAQKIIGFDFSASVTMDMTERINQLSGEIVPQEAVLPEERMIGFKCVDSQFFSEFDGHWKVKEQVAPDGGIETVCSYLVDVRPKGPVPVAALEWRIREDVPTNLRAVKAAAIKGLANPPRLAGSIVGAGTGASTIAQHSSLSSPAAPAARSKNGVAATQRKATAEEYASPVMMDWDRDETMAKYL